jgi:hypothetical protein
MRMFHQWTTRRAFPPLPVLRERDGVRVRRAPHEKTLTLTLSRSTGRGNPFDAVRALPAIEPLGGQCPPYTRSPVGSALADAFAGSCTESRFEPGDPRNASAKADPTGLLSRHFGPGGAVACSHGWSEAEPVVAVNVSICPGGATGAMGRSAHPNTSSAPSEQGQLRTTHGFRCAPPVATSRGPSGAGVKDGGVAP